jgi:hypothetical protein
MWYYGCKLHIKNLNYEALQNVESYDPYSLLQFVSLFFTLMSPNDSNFILLRIPTTFCVG